MISAVHAYPTDEQQTNYMYFALSFTYKYITRPTQRCHRPYDAPQIQSTVYVAAITENGVQRSQLSSWKRLGLLLQRSCSHCDRGDRSDQNFPNGLYFSGHANYIWLYSIAEFWFLKRSFVSLFSAIGATAMIVAIILKASPTFWLKGELWSLLLCCRLLEKPSSNSYNLQTCETNLT